MNEYYVERIRRGVDFIEERLDVDVALSDVARAAGMSQWHFQRIFRSLAGETLKTYIRSRRLARALERLATTDLRVLDVALLAGFESQEAFARAFRRAFGMSPTAYRRLGQRNLFPKKLELDEGQLRHVQQQACEPEIREQPAMTLVGARTTFFGVDSEKNNLGDKLPPLWDAFLPRRGEIEGGLPDVCYGVVQPTEGEELAYHAAIEVRGPRDAPLPPGLHRIEVPGGRYARFTHRGPAKDVDRTVSFAYSTWLLTSGRRHSLGPDLEIYDERWDAEREDSELVYALPLA